MPEAELALLAGETFRLLAGKGPYLINFWATWCVPCRREMKALDRVFKDLAPRGLGVVGVSVDTDVFLVREFVLREQLAFPIALDKGETLARQRFAVKAYPTSFLVDAAGLVAEVWIGERDWDAEDIRHRLEKLI